MPRVKAYHRPANLSQALQLLDQAGSDAAVVAGGTWAVPRLGEAGCAVIDLQAAGLDRIEREIDRLALGATVRLQDVADDERIPNLVRQAAHREGPNTLRNAATVGGTVVGAGGESEFLAALLACAAQVEIQTAQGARRLPLSELLADVPAVLGGGLLTAVHLATDGRTAAERLARTPADAPIVAALGRRAGDGTVHLALCGVATTPVLVAPHADRLAETLAPPGDFRGSSDYRRQMAVVLARRVLAGL